MSIVPRTLDGREYLHVRRKIDGIGKNRYINVTGLFGKELALKRYKANQLDKELREQQKNGSDSLMSLFVHPDGRMKHIIIQPKSKKNGICVKCVIRHKGQANFHKSLSIKTHTLDGAIKKMVKLVAGHFGLSNRTTTYKVLRALYLQQLREDYGHIISNSIRQY